MNESALEQLKEWFNFSFLFISYSTLHLSVNHLCISFVSEFFGSVMSKKGLGRPSKVRSSHRSSATGRGAGVWAVLKFRIGFISR